MDRKQQKSELVDVDGISSVNDEADSILVSGRSPILRGLADLEKYVPKGAKDWAE